MILLYVIIVIIVIFIVIMSINNNKRKQVIEHFYDIIPYEYHMRIFRCLTNQCVLKESYNCKRWCDDYNELGAQERCRMRCSDYADIQNEQLRFNRYNLGSLLPKFKDHNMFNDIEWF